MSKTKLIGISVDSITMVMQREQMTVTGAYDKLKSTPSIMDDLSAYILEYISYSLSMSVVFTLKYILGMSIFVSNDSE